jgi:hypothetical protein
LLSVVERREHAPAGVTVTLSALLPADRRAGGAGRASPTVADALAVPITEVDDVTAARGRGVLMDRASDAQATSAGLGVEHAGAAGRGASAVHSSLEAVGAMHCGVLMVPPWSGRRASVATSALGWRQRRLDREHQPAVPATSGAEKLVPSDGASKLSV